VAPPGRGRCAFVVRKSLARFDLRDGRGRIRCLCCGERPTHWITHVWASRLVEKWATPSSVTGLDGFFARRCVSSILLLLQALTLSLLPALAC
jgi:hypothetical protein